MSDQDGVGARDDHDSPAAPAASNDKVDLDGDEDEDGHEGEDFNPETFLVNVGYKMVDSLLEAEPQLRKAFHDFSLQQIEPVEIGSVCTGSGMAEVACGIALRAISDQAKVAVPFTSAIQFGCLELR